MLAQFRAGLRVGAVILLFLFCAPLHILTKSITGRSPWPRWSLGSALWIFGGRVRLFGAPVSPHTLLLPNHVSWLDIMVLGSVTGCAFVSKDQLGHPLVHWLADQNGTIYVKRTHVKGARDQAVTLASALAGDQPVAVFPEGTVGPGTHLLPFRSSLLEAVNYAGKEVTVRPVALDYGAAAPAIAWFQEPVLGNIRRVLGRRGTLQVDLHLLEPLERTGDRKAMTAAARAEIADTLGFTGEEPSPIGGAE